MRKKVAYLCCSFCLLFSNALDVCATEGCVDDLLGIYLINAPQRAIEFINKNYLPNAKKMNTKALSNTLKLTCVSCCSCPESDLESLSTNDILEVISPETLLTLCKIMLEAKITCDCEEDWEKDDNSVNLVCDILKKIATQNTFLDLLGPLFYFLHQFCSNDTITEILQSILFENDWDDIIAFLDQKNYSVIKARLQDDDFLNIANTCVKRGCIYNLIKFLHFSKKINLINNNENTKQNLLIEEAAKNGVDNVEDFRIGKAVEYDNGEIKTTNEKKFRDAIIDSAKFLQDILKFCQLDADENEINLEDNNVRLIDACQKNIQYIANMFGLMKTEDDDYTINEEERNYKNHSSFPTRMCFYLGTYPFWLQIILWGTETALEKFRSNVHVLLENELEKTPESEGKNQDTIDRELKKRVIKEDWLSVINKDLLQKELKSNRLSIIDWFLLNPAIFTLLSNDLVKGVIRLAFKLEKWSLMEKLFVLTYDYNDESISYTFSKKLLKKVIKKLVQQDQTELAKYILFNNEQLKEVLDHSWDIDDTLRTLVNESPVKGESKGECIFSFLNEEQYDDASKLIYQDQAWRSLNIDELKRLVLSLITRSLDTSLLTNKGVCMRLKLKPQNLTEIIYKLIEYGSCAVVSECFKLSDLLKLDNDVFSIMMPVLVGANPAWLEDDNVLSRLENNDLLETLYQGFIFNYILTLAAIKKNKGILKRLTPLIVEPLLKKLWDILEIDIFFPILLGLGSNIPDTLSESLLPYYLLKYFNYYFLHRTSDRYNGWNALQKFLEAKDVNITFDKKQLNDFLDSLTKILDSYITEQIAILSSKKHKSQYSKIFIDDMLDKMKFMFYNMPSINLLPNQQLAANLLVFCTQKPELYDMELFFMSKFDEQFGQYIPNLIKVLSSVYSKLIKINRSLSMNFTEWLAKFNLSGSSFKRLWLNDKVNPDELACIKFSVRNNRLCDWMIFHKNYEGLKFFINECGLSPTASGALLAAINKDQDMIDWLFESYPRILENIGIDDLNYILEIICPSISSVLDLEKLLLNHAWSIINGLNNETTNLGLVTLFLPMLNNLSVENAKEAVMCDLANLYKQKKKCHALPRDLSVADAIRTLYPKVTSATEVNRKFTQLLDLKLNKIIHGMSFREKMKLVEAKNHLLFFITVVKYFDQEGVLPLPLFILSFIEKQLKQTLDINDIEYLLT